MSEWWTYSLHDFLLFSARTYYRLIELYNADIWPVQVLAWLANALIAVLALRAWRSRPDIRQGGVADRDRLIDGAADRQSRTKTSGAGSVVLVVLAAAWTWSAWGWLWQRYATINWAATYAAGAFAMEAAMLLIAAARTLIARQFGNDIIVRASPSRRFTGVVSDTRNEIDSPTAKEGNRAHSTPSFATGVVLLFASLAYPAIALLAGRSPRTGEVFAAMPDPTVIGTLGALVLLSPHGRWFLLIVPLLWCLAAGATLWALPSPEAPVLPMAGIAAVIALSKARVQWTERGPG